MRKRGATIRKSRYRADPPIVRSIIDQTNEIAIRMAVESLANGSGTVNSLDTIMTHLHLLQFAADSKEDPKAALVCDVAGVAIESIIDRFKNTNRIGATGEERKAIEMLRDESLDFWKRQSGMTRDACVQAVNHWYGEIERKRNESHID